MSKAVEGAVLVGIGAAAFAVLTGGAGLAAESALLGVMGSSATTMSAIAAVTLGGVSMEAAAIASALTSNRGMNITTRQTAAFRQVIYGQQRVGGVEIFNSTTGSHKDQQNFVIILAGHVCDSIEALYLDGRQVFFNGGVGNTTRNGVNFGGSFASGSHTGPNGVQYDFGGLGYCEARYGDQLPGDVIGGLTANDPSWGYDPTTGDSPWVGGCTYVYLKLEYSTTMFPSQPEIRFTVNGKSNVWDPRDSTYKFTSNWALICADVLTDTQFGLGDPSVNQLQLIAAANICDEIMPVAALSSGATAMGAWDPTVTYSGRQSVTFGGLTYVNLTDAGDNTAYEPDQYPQWWRCCGEAAYTTNYHYDSGVGPGDALASMMPGAAGRLSRIGGEWFIWPAYYQGVSATYDANSFTAAPTWTPYRSIRDLFNRVNGTYTAPNYPFNVAGNLYDSNLFYDGQQQDNFPYAYQPTNYPQYACDVLHGYASDALLAADGGRQLAKELVLSTVISVTQAQRVAKIFLMRNRQQGSGTLHMSLNAYKQQPCDVMQLNFADLGFADKALEITGVGFTCEQVGNTQDDSKALSIGVSVNVIETDPSVYEWSPTEELTVYDVPSTPAQQDYTPAPPTNMSLTSSLATALIGLDGVVQPRVEVQWETPLDVRVTQIQVQHQLVDRDLGNGPWLNGGSVDVSQTSTFVGGVSSGLTYDFRIRSVRPSGATSAWVEIDGFLVGTVLTVLKQTALAQTSLTSVAYVGGTASIYGLPFTAPIGNQTLSVSPSNYPLAGLNQNQLYYVYYIDPTFAGGAVTAIATQNQADFLNKPGYFFIGSLVTAVYGGGTATTGPWYPSAYADQQHGAAFFTTNPMVPYSTSGLYSGQYALLGSVYVPSVPETLGTDIIYSGFINSAGATGICAGASGLTLGFANQGLVSGAGGQFTVSISYDNGATWTVVATQAAPGLMSVAEVDYSLPAGTDMSQVQVEIAVSPVASGATNGLSLELVYIVIQASTYRGVHPLHV
jgi:hypothetical protein